VISRRTMARIVPVEAGRHRIPASRTVPRGHRPLAGAMYLACTSDVLPMHPRYISAASVTPVPSATHRQRRRRPPEPRCACPAATDHLPSQRILLSQQGAAESCQAWATLLGRRYLVLSRCVMPSDGVPGPPQASPPDKITTREQTWSKHGPETAFSWPPGMGINPGQNGCAARDSNPEPAD
jgi:hypothetical protein